MAHLPQLQTREEFHAAFPRSDLWGPAIACIANQHGLTATPVRGVLGSNIVYRVGEAWIKLFAPFFQNEFEIEIAGLEISALQSAFAVPRIIARGVFDGWSYMVLSHVEGSRIGDVWSEASDARKAGYSEQIAIVTRELQKLPAPEIIATRFDWNPFIQDRFEKAVSTQVMKGLDAESARKLERFVGQFQPADFFCARPVFLHADLTHDHFLIANGHGNVAAVIDFADAMVGHPEYDLAASFSFLFHGQKDAQEHFYRAWGERLTPERILMWIILHRFSDLRRYFGADAFEPYGDFNDFAREKFA